MCSERSESVLTAEVWKAMTERKSSEEVFLANGREADELRSPAKSENPFPFACNKYTYIYIYVIY